MPRKLLVGPPGAEKRHVWQNQENWPEGSGFQEESFPRPHHLEYKACAQRFAEHIAAGERVVYVKAVAKEATKRVLRLHLFEQSNRELLTGYAHESAEVPYQDQVTHALHMRRELAWEREKWSVQHNTFQWRHYKYDPRFLCWLHSVPAGDLTRWASTYLVERPQKLSLMRQDLAQLAPMPQEIRKAHFFTTAENRQLLTMSGAEVNFGATTEHHISLVCQRLLAYHTVGNARHGPAHLAHMAKMLERHLAFKRQDRWSAEQLIDIVARAGIFSQGRVTKPEVVEVMLRVNAALQRARAVLDGRSDMLAELAALRPNCLDLRDPCPTCFQVKGVLPEEAKLPPFHPRCRCFRLAWRSIEVPELERQVALWSLECALGGDRTPQFPFDEFIAECEKLRGRAPRPAALDESTAIRPATPWPPLRSDSRLRARMMRPPLPGQGPPDPMLAVSSVAVRLGVSTQYVRDLCNEGKLGQVVLTEGGHRRIRSSGVEAYLKVRTRQLVQDARQSAG